MLANYVKRYVAAAVSNFICCNCKLACILLISYDSKRLHLPLSPHLFYSWECTAHSCEKLTTNSYLKHVSKFFVCVLVCLCLSLLDTSQDLSNSQLRLLWLTLCSAQTSLFKWIKYELSRERGREREQEINEIKWKMNSNWNWNNVVIPRAFSVKSSVATFIYKVSLKIRNK